MDVCPVTLVWWFGRLLTNNLLVGHRLWKTKKKHQKTTPLEKLLVSVPNLKWFSSHLYCACLVEITGVLLIEMQSEFRPHSLISSQQCSHLNLGIISFHSSVNEEQRCWDQFEDVFRTGIRFVTVDLSLQSHPPQKLWAAWQTDDIDFKGWVLLCVFSRIIDGCLNWILMSGTICFMWGSGLSFERVFAEAARTAFLWTPTVVFRKWSNSSEISVPVSLMVVSTGSSLRVYVSLKLVGKGKTVQQSVVILLSPRFITDISLGQEFAPQLFFIAMFSQSRERLAGCHAIPRRTEPGHPPSAAMIAEPLGSGSRSRAVLRY